MSIAKKLLKSRKLIFEELYTQDDSAVLSLKLFLISLAGIAIYGIAMGTYHSDPLLWLIMGGKILLVLFGSVILAVPTLYTILSMRGSKSTFVQVITLILGALATSGLIMLSLVPIVWFFTLSTQNMYVLILMNMFMVGFSVLFGLIFLVQGVVYEHKGTSALAQTGATAVLLVWVALAAIVSLQMVYNVRPFFHEGPGYIKVNTSQEMSLQDISQFTSENGLQWICASDDQGCLEYYAVSHTQTTYDENGYIIENTELGANEIKNRNYFYAIMPFEGIESKWVHNFEKKKNIERVEFVNEDVIDESDRIEKPLF